MGRVTTKSIVGKGNIAEQKLVTVYGTKKSQFMKTGEGYEVTKAHADKIVKNGHATFKK